MIIAEDKNTFPACSCPIATQSPFGHCVPQWLLLFLLSSVMPWLARSNRPSFLPSILIIYPTQAIGKQPIRRRTPYPAA